MAEVGSLKKLQELPHLRKLNIYLKIKLNQLYAVSRTPKGRQREPSVKSLRSTLSAEFWRHYLLSGETQRRS